MTLETVIKKSLEKTLDCKFKKTIMCHLLGNGWTCVHIDKFSKQLSETLKKEMS